MLAIVVSRADSASLHIQDHLLALADWRESDDDTRPDGEGGGTVYRTDDIEMREFDNLHLDLDHVADAFDDPDLLAFASRHSGETGALLTAHHTGNFGPAEYGGEDNALARACPNAHRRVLDAFREHAPEEYEVGTECTHHGPSDVGVPSLFVELGSDEPQWEDPGGARAVARAILALRDVTADAPRKNGSRRHLVGFGGGHYAPRFERIVRETDWAVGHVAADWCLDAMGDPAENEDVLRQAFEESAATHAVVDGDRPDLVRVVEDLGYRVVSETWVRETTGIPLSLVESVENELGPIESGVRFGERAPEAESFSVEALPSELVAAARAVDQEQTRAAVEARTVAFETTHSGAQVGERAAFESDADRERLVDDLADVLLPAYDAVERTPDAVVVTETAFEPERARTLGVPEGPKFGKLSSGQSVTVDGETIAPETVHVERERRFPVR